MTKQVGTFNIAQWAAAGIQQQREQTQKYLPNEGSMRAVNYLGSFVRTDARTVSVYHDPSDDRTFYVNYEGRVLGSVATYSDGIGAYDGREDEFLFYQKTAVTVYTAYMLADDGELFSLTATSRGELKAKVDKQVLLGHTAQLYTEHQLFI